MALSTRAVNFLFGRPLATSEERAEHIGPIAGIPIFGLDALSSAAYGPEAALTLLIPLGLVGVHYIVPVSAAIVVLLVIVFFSYRQTIEAYPQGGGSYTVASQNLGEGAALLAAAALMIDYILTAAVGISAGVGALISAVPSLQPHTLELCLLVLGLLTRVGGLVGFLLPIQYFIGKGAYTHLDSYAGLDTLTSLASALNLVLPTGAVFGLDALIGRRKKGRGPG